MGTFSKLHFQFQIQTTVHSDQTWLFLLLYLGTKRGGAQISTHYNKQPTTHNYNKQPTMHNYNKQPTTHNYNKQPTMHNNTQLQQAAYNAQQHTTTTSSLQCTTHNYNKQPTTHNYNKQPTTHNYNKQPTMHNNTQLQQAAYNAQHTTTTSSLQRTTTHKYNKQPTTHNNTQVQQAAYNVQVHDSRSQSACRTWAPPGSTSPQPSHGLSASRSLEPWHRQTVILITTHSATTGQRLAEQAAKNEERALGQWRQDTTQTPPWQEFKKHITDTNVDDTQMKKKQTKRKQT